MVAARASSNGLRGFVTVCVAVFVAASLLLVPIGAAFAQSPTAAPPPTYAPPPGPYSYPPPGTYPPAPATPYGPPGAYPYPPPGTAYAPAGVYPGAPPVVVASPRENSFNLSPLGLLYGSYSLNYEHLSGGTHGLLIDGHIDRDSGTASASDSSGTTTGTSRSTDYGIGVGYRWHWSGEQSSGFLGLMAGYTVGSGTSTLTSGNMTSRFDLKIRAPWVVANIGKRWQWDSGLNITFRIGGGLAKYTVTTTSMDPDAQTAVKFLQDILTLLPIAFDGELSVGYTF
jgi:hypothetical protein